jgi:hypothetical protein
MARSRHEAMAPKVPFLSRLAAAGALRGRLRDADAVSVSSVASAMGEGRGEANAIVRGSGKQGEAWRVDRDDGAQRCGEAYLSVSERFGGRLLEALPNGSHGALAGVDVDVVLGWLAWVEDLFKE